MTTDSTGHYQLVKSGPGSGVALGTYAATVGRRAYLGASKANQVTIAAGSNTINNLADAPTLLGGEVTGDGKVGIEDLTQVAGVFGTPPAGGADTGADINGDNIINIFDLVMVGSNYDLTTSNWP
jgi:hypothetical protein